MVRTRSPGGPTAAGAERRDRAQLVVVGAVVLAFLILALVPVYNAVFAADSAGNGEPVELSERALTVDGAAAEQARVLAVRVGHREPYPDAAALKDRYERALANGTAALTEATIRGSDYGLNVSFDRDAPGTVVGSRVLRTDAGSLDGPGGNADWTVASDTRLGWGVVRLETANLTGTLVVEATDADNASRYVELRLERSDASNDIRVTAVVDGEVTEPASCEPTGGEIVVDLYRGRSAAGGCPFEGLGTVSGPVDLDVEIKNGGEARGTYEFVVRDGAAVDSGVTRCSGGSGPCRSPALWRVALDTRVAGDRATYTTTTDVSVYGGAI
jgi:hypothetical protein